VGLAARLFEERSALLRRAQQLVAGCECEAGCPSCIGPPAQLEAPFPRKRILLDLLQAAEIL
jgi:DEAD/DEAH box helicase domain-containing protein